MLMTSFVQSPIAGVETSGDGLGDEAEHLEIISKNNTSFTIQVSDIPPTPSKLVCQTYRPQLWMVGFWEVENYNQPWTDEQILQEREQSGEVNSRVHSWDGIPAEMRIYCEFFTSSTSSQMERADELSFRMDGIQNPSDHHWANFSVFQDWDGLWVEWTPSEDETNDFDWIRVELRHGDSADLRNGGMSKRGLHEPGRHYIGGIAEGGWLVSLVALDPDGMLTQMEWFLFDNPASSCGEKGDPSCPSEVPVSRVNHF